MTSFKFTITPLASLEGNVLSVIILNASLIPDIYGNPVYNQTNNLTLGTYYYIPQNSAYIANQDQMAAVATAVVIFGFIPMTVNGGLGALWGLIDVLQMLFYYIYINIDLPLNFQNFLLLFKISLIPLPNIAGDLLSQISQAFNIPIPTQTGPAKFDQQGISAFFLENGGSILFFLGFACLTIYLMESLSKLLTLLKMNFIQKLIIKLHKRMKWSYAIRFLITNYLQLSCAVCLQLTKFDVADSFSVTGQVFNFLALSVFSIWCIYMTKLRTAIPKNEDFDRKFAAIFEEIKDDSLIASNFNSVICIRKMCFVASIVLLYPYPYVNLIFLTI